MFESGHHGRRSIGQVKSASIGWADIYRILNLHVLANKMQAYLSTHVAIKIATLKT